jgi:hypothetical protein
MTSFSAAKRGSQYSSTEWAKELRIHAQNTFTLKRSAFCDGLYRAGYFSIVSAEHTLSNKPIASGGAAVNS